MKQPIIARPRMISASFYSRIRKRFLAGLALIILLSVCSALVPFNAIVQASALGVIDRQNNGPGNINNDLNGLTGKFLVIAPHPDDDIITAAGIIYNAIQAGDQCKVVFMTNGDDYTNTALGYKRENEAVNGESYLGMTENNLIFLGYPDGGLYPIFNSYRGQNDVYTTNFGQSQTYGDRGLGGSDYHTYRFGSPALYNMYNILMDLEDILSSYQPDQIFTTSEFDRHPDHSTTYQLLEIALAYVELINPTYSPIVHTTLVHTPPLSWPNPLDPTVDFISPDLTATPLVWSQRESFEVPLVMQSTDFTINPKYLAVAAHVTQGGTSEPLGQFIHKDEFFWAENRLGLFKLSVSNFISPATAGVAGNFTVTAQDAAGNTITNYTGIIYFTSSDPQAVRPQDYTFVNSDNGTHTFSTTFKTAGSQSITAADYCPVTNYITGIQSGITVVPAAASQIRIETAANGSGVSAPAQNVISGNSITIYAVTRDQYGNFVANAAGTWSLINKTGGVADSDLVVSGDKKSAVFSGNLAGTAVIQVTSGTLTNTPSGTLTVNLASQSDATLSNLTISSGTFIPAFASGTISYTDSVANSVTSVTVTPTTNQTNAAVKVNGVAVTSGSSSGAITLNVGSNTITTLVKAQNGTTTKTYTIVVTRAATLSSDATLSSLGISSGTLTPAFASGTTSYTDSVANSVSSVTITPTTNQANATVKVNGVAVTSGSSSGAITLNVGSNAITTLVTAQNGTTTKTYTIVVTRQPIN